MKKENHIYSALESIDRLWYKSNGEFHDKRIGGKQMFNCYECGKEIDSTDELKATEDLIYDGESWYKQALCPHCGIAFWLIPTDADPMSPNNSNN